MVGMKIDELVAKLNELKSLRAEKKSDGILIYSKQSTDYDFFFSLAYKNESLADVGFDWDCLKSVEPADLHKALNLVDCFIHTPINERFPEKEWYLCIGVNSKGHKVYLVRDYDAREIVTNINKDCMSPFTDRQVEELKKEFPKLAPSIDAMKEPAEDECERDGKNGN